ncbi:MAG: hypothetical protein RL217_1679 [Pseudomonadota bacterium]|jgi:uncharacterized membrane protein YedE/YeeE
MKTMSLSKLLAALVCGFIFGLGLLLSGMNDPAKVRAFLDVFGAWGPELIAVMGSAVVVFAIAFKLSGRMVKPLFAHAFHEPSLKQIDLRLVGGALLFGIGWGLVGLCPGPALVDIFSGNTDVLLFVAAMLVGNRVAHYAIGPAK